MLPGGEEITYLRALALLDTVPIAFYAQPFSVWEERRLRANAVRKGYAHPWRARFEGAASRAPSRLGTLEWGLLRPELQLIYNTALPSTRNDGVVWAGRGATTVAQAGVRAQWGPVRMQFAPIGFVTENADFEIAANGQTGALAFGDARYPSNIDLPQRFGEGQFSRLDLGETFLSIEGFGLATGFSSSRIAWGPAYEQNLVFSTNAGGFPHFFLGTSKPLVVWIGSINGRLIAGKLEQSDYSPVQSGQKSRFQSAFVGSYSPALWPGLEVGAVRTMQAIWRPGGPTIAEVLRPFSAVVSDPNTGSVPNIFGENGFASVFARAAIPSAGIEIYGEISREDFTGNLRWFLAKPDDLALLLLGVTRARVDAEGRMTVVRIEHVNGEVAQHERGQRSLRRPTPNYMHGHVFQGLTSRGQILGSAAGFGGAGSTLTLERYTPRGRSSISVERQLRLDWTRPMGNIGGLPDAETLLGVRYERQASAAGQEFTWSVRPARVLNRNVVPGSDLWSLEFSVGWRGW